MAVFSYLRDVEETSRLIKLNFQKSFVTSESKGENVARVDRNFKELATLWFG